MRIRDYEFDKIPALRHLERDGRAGSRPGEVRAGKLALGRAIAQITDLTHDEARALVGLVMDLQWHVLMRGWRLRIPKIGDIGLQVRARRCGGAIVGEAVEIRLGGRASAICGARWRAIYLEEWHRRRAAGTRDAFGPSDAPWLGPDGRVHVAGRAGDDEASDDG